MRFQIEDFNRTRQLRNKPAVKMWCLDGDDLLWLWMSQGDLLRNIRDHGPHFDLLHAAAQYGMRMEPIVNDWKRTNKPPFYEERAVERDEMGYWRHEHHPTCPDKLYTIWSEYLGFEHVVQLLADDERDESKDVRERYAAGDPDVLAWEPEKPDGEGWYLASIHQTEDDGAAAVWIRKKVTG